jgi:phosphonate transport system permease protein
MTIANEILPRLQPPPGRSATGAPAAVSLDDVQVVYPGNIKALRGVTLHIAPGEHVSVLGASGSGKTTLMGLLAGRVTATAGTVRVVGRVATIHQDLRLVKQRSALQNVLHGCMGRHSTVRTIARFPAAERARATDLLQRVGLDHRLHSPVGRLSGGEQQRVAIARALMQDPAILVADEPVASLDNANARSIMRLLSELQKERGITLVSVLHDCALAETFADRIIGIEAGQIVHDDVACDGPLDARAGASAGLRGFRRFEACRACETINLALASPKEINAPAAGRATPWLWAIGAVVVLGIYAWAVAGLEIGGRASEGWLANTSAFAARMLPDSWAQFRGIDWWALCRAMVATLQMTLVGTTLAVLISWPLAALAARNVGPRWLRPVTRFGLNALRSVPSIIWALLFVCAVGLGAFAGVLALVAYSIGYLTKFYYEAFEAVDPGAPGALAEIGASGPQRFLHAVWPAGRAAVMSSSLFMLEYNVRAASVLGIVGAGGIGYELKLHVDYGNFHVVGAILLMLVVLVLVLDAISSRLRARLMA